MRALSPTALLPVLFLLSAPAWSESPSLNDRIRGLLIGSLIGDALGGPTEFEPWERVLALPNSPKKWEAQEELTVDAHAEARKRLILRSYRDLRPEPAPYAHWTKNALPGTLTDDSRHKMILIQALRTESLPSAKSLAQAYFDWEKRSFYVQNPHYHPLNEEALREYHLAARWVLGNRDPRQALPPERLWSGLPTCCGQMGLPPLAALFPGKPEEAYQCAYQIAFYDNGFGKDLNAALVAGLATALTLPPLKKGQDPWEPVFQSIRQTDPYRYGEIPWSGRATTQWLDKIDEWITRHPRRPGALFKEFDQAFAKTIKWQAEVPFAVALALLRLCPDHPLTALQLSIEWGQDTDSYAALAGAFIGARYGENVFPESLREPVLKRMKIDYDETLDEWLKVLQSARQANKAK